MRQRDRNAGQMLGEQFADALLMRRIDDRPQKADGDRLNLLGLQPLDDLQHRRLVERDIHRAVEQHPFRNLEGQGARNVRLRIGNGEVERLDAAPLAQHQNFGVTPGR